MVRKVQDDQVCRFLESELGQHLLDSGAHSARTRVKAVHFEDPSTLVCDFYTHEVKSLAVKTEIEPIMCALASFFKDNPHVHTLPQRFAVRAYSAGDEELMYAVSSLEAIEHASQGRPIEWLKGTLFQDNTPEHRLALAKRLISSIENALRRTIAVILGKHFGADWWTRAVPAPTRKTAEQALKSQTGATSGTGGTLLEYTFLVQLRDIVTDHCALLPESWSTHYVA